ncbi:MAG: glycosyltransferase family 2 protein [Thermoguttaceae bacterium]
MTATPISVCILTKNCESNIRRCLEPLRRFDEILVLDTGSTDRTVEIVQEYPNVRVFHQQGIDNFSDARNLISEKAGNDWLLHIDSDEFVTEDFINEIAACSLEPDTVYEIRRRMYYRHRALPGFDDWIKRLYNRTTTGWNGRAVHEIVDVRPEMKLKQFRSPIEHHSYNSVEELLHKAQMYSTLFADQFHTKKKGGLLKGILHGYWAFFRFYVLQKNCLKGYDGFITSYCFSFMSFLKYIKLYERQHPVLWTESDPKHAETNQKK